jgi:hypothetical protein
MCIATLNKTVTVFGLIRVAGKFFLNFANGGLEENNTMKIER